MRGSERGTYAGMNLTPKGGWLVFAFYPAGAEGEINASYEAVNVFTGQQVHLFRGGLGLGLFPNAQRIIFTRSTGDLDQAGTWVATILF
jgi:hypothetical protein